MFLPEAHKSEALWMTIGKIAGGILTAIVLYFLIRELIKIVKESNEGKCSDKCDLD
ncbi:hypothetical protein [Nitratifractor sp.]